MLLKRITRILKYLFLSLAILVAVILAGINLPVSQRFISGRANDYFSKKSLPVHVERISLLITGRIGIRRLKINGPENDTIVYADKINISARFIPLIRRSVIVNNITLKSAVVNLSVDDLSSELNIAEVFSNNDRPADSSGENGKKWEISGKKVSLDDVRFRFSDTRSGIEIRQSVGKLEVGLDELSIISKRINVGYIELSDADGGIVIRSGRKGTPESAVTSKSSPWDFRLAKADLRRIRYNLAQPDDNQELTFNLGRVEISGAGFDLGSEKITAEKTQIRDGSFKRSLLSSDSASSGGNQLLSFSDFNTLIGDLLLSYGSTGFNVEELSFKMGNGVTMRQGEISLISDSVKGSSLKADLKTGYGRINVAAKAGATLKSILGSYKGIPFSLKIDDTEIAGSELTAFLPAESRRISASGIEKLKVGISCDISGFAEDLSIDNATINTADGLTIVASGRIEGITDPETALISLSFKTGNVLPRHLRDLAKLSGTEMQISDFEPVSIAGTLDSSLVNPVFNVSVQSGSGNIIANGSINRLRKDYTLEMILSGVDMGVLADIRKAGRLTGKINLKGADFDPHLMKLFATASIDTLQYNDYNYTGLEIKVRADTGVFKVNLQSDDQSISCDLEGVADITNSPLTANLKGRLDIDAGKLNLLKDIKFSGLLNGEVQRSEAILQGKLALADIVVTRSGHSEDLDNLSVTFQYTDTLTTGTMEADFLNADGYYRGAPDGLLQLIRNNRIRGFAMVDSAVGNSIPYLSAIEEMKISVGSTYDPFIGLFLSDSIFSYNELSVMIYKDTTDVAKAEIFVDRINAGNSRVSGASVIMESLSDRSLLNIKADSIRFAGISLSTLAASLTVENDSAKFLLRSGSNSDSLIYDFSGTAFRSDGDIRIRSDIRDWIINGYRWKISPGDILVLEPGTDDFTADLHLFDDYNHAIDLYGRKSENLILETKEVGLKMIFPPGTDISGYNGIFTGRADYRSAEGKNMIGVEMKVDSISMDQKLLGKIEMQGSYSSDTLGTIESAIDLVINDTSAVGITVRSSDIKGESSIRTELSDVQLSVFGPFAAKYVKGLSGVVNGSLDIISRENNPLINGDLKMKNTSLKLVPVNSWYFLSDDEIVIKNNKLIFNRFTVKDSLNNPLILNGILDLADPGNITADLQVTSDRIRVMNTTSAENSAFNGSVFINSRINIRGSLRNPSIDGNLVLADGTVINYRYTENLSLSETGKIVTFASLKNEKSDTVAAMPFSEMISKAPDIEATVEIDPNSLFNFSVSKGFDIGVSIRGGGFLTYSLMPNNEIDLSGIYEINQGTSQLKLPGWPRKDFIITKGSVVRWDGTIDDPDLSIETTSNVRGSYLNPVDNQKREVSFVVTMKLQGRLSDLAIIFDVRSQDQYITTFFNSLSADERMRQAINLLIFERVELPGQTSSSDYLTQQISQFAENTINQATKSASKKLDLDVSLGVDTYTRATTTGEQTTTSLSYQVKKDMFNERGSVLLSGHTNAGTTASQQTNAVIENFIFEYALDSLRSKFLKIYRQQNYEDLLEGEVIKSGVGFIYRKNYDRISDIWRRQKRNKK